MLQSASGTAVSAARTRGQLLRILGVSFGIAVIVGDTIGSGILRTPGEIAADLGSYGWIIAVWLLGGAYALFCTVSVTELGTMLPFAGGWYVYSRKAFGEYGGLVVGCSGWTVQKLSTAYLAVAFAEFAAELQAPLRGHLKSWPRCRQHSDAAQLGRPSGRQSYAAGHESRQSSCHYCIRDRVFHLFPEQHSLDLSVAARQGQPFVRAGFVAAVSHRDVRRLVRGDLFHGRGQESRSSIGAVFVCIAIFLLVNRALFHIGTSHEASSKAVPIVKTIRL